MSTYNQLFRKRMGIPENKEITFQGLADVLERTAECIPFENLRIMANKTLDISKENLIHKLFVNGEGGLCYELNSMLYIFLIENGFDARLARGTVFDVGANKWNPLKNTHVTIIINENGHDYVVDTGFGANLPLKPVPLSGETVASRNGEFRIKGVNQNDGDFFLEKKLKHRSSDWEIGYIFHSKRPVNNMADFNEIQTQILTSNESPFNKMRLITQLNKEGSKTLTDRSFTQWVDGEVTKDTIKDQQFKEFAKHHFNINLV